MSKNLKGGAKHPPLPPTWQDKVKASNIHLAIVLEVTGLCGLTYEINNCVAKVWVNLSFLYILLDAQMDRF